MDRKLLFFDIDGTLLAGGIPGYIPESTMESLREAQANGHYLFINTGRTRSFLPEPVKEFPFDGYICGCGTEVIFQGKTLWHNEIPLEIRLRIPALLRETGVQGVGEGRESCYFENRDDFFPPIKEILDVYTKADSPQPIRMFDEAAPDFDKFVIFSNENSDLPAFRRATEDYFEYIGREDNASYQFAEFVPKHCSKATGIDYLVDHLGLCLDDCYVFGDSANDLPMLTHVKNSVAMGNSTPEVLMQTSYVTTPVDRDGIKNALSHFKLI